MSSMEFYDHLLATELSNMDAGVDDQDASMSLALMHSMPLNVMTMVEIFHRMVHNLPLVIDTLQEPEIPSNEPITALDNVVPTVSTTDPDLEAGMDNVALQFASNHLTPLTVLFGEFGVHGWVALCNQLILKYTACIRTESLQAFRQR
ncbi:hypothetical protein PISMIDRAFT_10735 [Pisolithus microcarpus 441]|uniref:Uncharacterized protein n=1 Tax=Pisolithus microcarpus 441 TaxID=765257 RepID=A0A0C9Z3T5_9AGAM|nr:hypothetical protein BKA83DRAFT_10735 [Pisolithus microcarpus]KIK23776.1 hypothetical protein PISMIDRAFT_10735 [Pisolithus microcarpus 441]